MGKFIDMTGWKMSEHGVKDSRITVVNRAPNQGKHVAWNCLCDCGATVVIRGDQLRSGIAKSCGCLFKEVSAEKCRKIGQNNKGRAAAHTKDLSGQVFSRLTVIEYYKTIKGKSYWKCLCECGTIVNVETSHLLSGHTKSCGCLTSVGEEKIKKIFIENNINYISQYTFDDLMDKKRLRFDFAIFKGQSLHCLVEYQGSQHFIDMKKSIWNSPQEHDKIKREYCKKNNILLIEISYKDLEKINWDYLKERCNL